MGIPHGKLPAKSLLCMKSGWSSRWGDPERYRNKDASNGKMHFPGFSADAAAFLRKERDVVGIGIDTLSLDRGIDEEFPVHQVMLGGDDGGLYQVENMVLDELPAVGFLFVVLPFNVKGAQESLCRCVALMP